MSVKTQEKNKINRERASQANRVFSNPFLSAEAEDELVAGGEEAADIRPAVQATEEEATRDRRAVSSLARTNYIPPEVDLAAFIRHETRIPVVAVNSSFNVGDLPS